MKEQLFNQGITVANAVGERAVGVAVRVSDLAREDTSKLAAGAGVLLVLIGISALASGALSKRDVEQEARDQIREENEPKDK